MNRLRTLKIAACAAAAFVSSLALAEEHAPPASETQTDAARIDRDGKHICGYDLMSDTERGGYRNMMHQTKSQEDRDAIRADHCARMRARAKERGVAPSE